MWFKIKDQEVTFSICAKPFAKKTAILKIDEDALYIAVHAQPKEGEANKELINFLAKLFRIPKKDIILQSGEASRQKIVRLPLNLKIQEFITNPTLFLNR